MVDCEHSDIAVHLSGVFSHQKRQFLKASVFDSTGACTEVEIPCELAEAMAARALLELIEKQIRLTQPDLLR